MSSTSSLKSVNTILKDEKYRGQTASRKDLFEGPRILEEQDGEREEDDDEFNESGEELSGEVSGESEESPEESDELSESADPDGEGQEEQDEGDRRDKVRQLLAQETQYRSFLSEICLSIAGPSPKSFRRQHVQTQRRAEI